MKKWLRKSLSFLLSGAITASLLIQGGLIASACDTGKVIVEYMLVNSANQPVMTNYAHYGVIETLPTVTASAGDYYTVGSAPASISDKSGHHFTLKSTLPVKSAEKVRANKTVYAYVCYVEPAVLTLKGVDQNNATIAGIADVVKNNYNVGDPFPTPHPDATLTDSNGKVYTFQSMAEAVPYFVCSEKVTLTAKYSDIYNYTIQYVYAGNTPIVKTGKAEYGTKLSALADFSTDPATFGAGIPDAGAYYEISALNANGAAVTGDSILTNDAGSNSITVTFSDNYAYNVYYFLNGTQYSVVPIPLGKQAFGTPIGYFTDPSKVFSDTTGITFVDATWNGAKIAGATTPAITDDDTKNVVVVSFTSQYAFSASYTEDGKAFGKADYTSGSLPFGTDVAAGKVPGLLSGLPDGYKLNSVTVDGKTVLNPTDAAQVLLKIAVNNEATPANHVVVDYTKDAFAYTVNYIDKATGNAIASDGTAKALFGSTVTKGPITITGYKPVSTDSQSIVIASDSTKNVINFYYNAITTVTPATTPTAASPNPQTGDRASAIPAFGAFAGLATMITVVLRRFFAKGAR